HPVIAHSRERRNYKAYGNARRQGPGKAKFGQEVRQRSENKGDQDRDQKDNEDLLAEITNGADSGQTQRGNRPIFSSWMRPRNRNFWRRQLLVGRFGAAFSDISYGLTHIIRPWTPIAAHNSGPES